MSATVGLVEQVSLRASHGVGKDAALEIRLVEGIGVEGDAHAGATVKHRSRVRRDPDQPNLRQVHLIHAELHEEMAAGGFQVAAGEMGENVTTRGVDLLALPYATRLRLGSDAVVQLTGLRNPCVQLEGIAAGLMRAVVGQDEAGRVIRKAGVMAIVVRGGTVRPGDPIDVHLPPPPHHRLEKV